MADPPEIDGRRRGEIRKHLESIAPYYTDEWDPDADDPGSALVATFSELTEEVLTRLDRVPEKQFMAFLDSLGATRRPPQSARLPLVVEVADDADGPVAIPGGTQAVAASTDARPEQVFEIEKDDGFEATPANIHRVYSVDPATDSVFTHGASVTDGSGFRLFDGDNDQEHALYMGDDALLNLAPGSSIRITMETTLPERVLRRCLVWEYYGEREVDGELETGWHTLDSRVDHDDTDGCPWSEAALVEEFLESEREWFESHGYVRGDLPPETHTRVLGRIADEIRGRSADDPGEDPPIPRTLLSPGPGDEEFAASLRGKLRGLQRRLETVTETEPHEQRWLSHSRATIPLELPGSTVEEAVAGIESRWIRCRLPPGAFTRELFDVAVRQVSLDVGAGQGTDDDGIGPDAMLTDDVPLAVDDRDGDLRPFGADPQQRTTFAVASTEAFTKAETTVTLRFTRPSGETASISRDQVEVSWEYWNGNGWSRLPIVTDATAELTQSGGIRFEVPRDLQPTRVAGHEGHWIRARVVSGTYGRTRYTETDGTWELDDSGLTPPQFGDVRIEYTRTAPPDHLVRSNNRSVSGDLTEDVTRGFRPFTGISDTEQTLYVGFDGPLERGPISLFVPLEETAYPDGFDPQIRWEYCADPDGEEWTSVNVRDETRGLRQTGIVSLLVDDETAEVELFDEECHWIRARVTGDAFTAPAATVFDPPDRTDTDAGGVAEPHRATVRTAPPTDTPIETPPTLRSLYVNAGWASNRRTVTDEVVGSSDGAQHQQFTLANPPVTDDPAEVWVDELAVLPEQQRRAFAERRPERVNSERGPNDDLRAFWILWEEVTDFLGSGEDDRHYTIDRTTGQLTFGDGIHGKIPPRGRNNVRASYRTGGGEDGNVAENAITGFKRSIPLVDGVSNPEPGGGGATQESPEQVRTRAPKQLRDRGRPVLPADFERIANAAARDIARTRCLAGMDAAGAETPGWVTVIIVPNTKEERPEPSVTLKRQVTETLKRRAPASVVDAERSRLVVRGPSYVDVSVTASLEATAVESYTELESHIGGRLGSFLHPLTGGFDGDGWAFGTVPHRSDLYALLEGIDGVDHVEDLTLTYAGDDDTTTVPEHVPTPRVTPDTLVFGGTHDITVTGGE